MLRHYHDLKAAPMWITSRISFFIKSFVCVLLYSSREYRFRVRILDLAVSDVTVVQPLARFCWGVIMFTLLSKNTR